MVRVRPSTDRAPTESGSTAATCLMARTRAMSDAGSVVREVMSRSAVWSGPFIGALLDGVGCAVALGVGVGSELALRTGGPPWHALVSSAAATRQPPRSRRRDVAPRACSIAPPPGSRVRRFLNARVGSPVRVDRVYEAPP